MATPSAPINATTGSKVKQFATRELEFYVDCQEKTDVGGRAHEIDERHVDVVQQVNAEIDFSDIAPRIVEQYAPRDKDDCIEPGFLRNISAGKIAQHDDKAQHAAEEDTLLHEEEHVPVTGVAYSASKHPVP